MGALRPAWVAAALALSLGGCHSGRGSAATPADSTRSASLYQNGVKYWDKGDYESARKEWGEALSLDPKNADARAGLERLGQLYREPKLEEEVPQRQPR